MLAHWNRGYGTAGFAQYQFVIPFEDGPRRLREILTTILSSSELPFLNVLKCFGKQGEGLLSFPREGYTFAIDFPIRKHTAALLKRLDTLVLDAGGRIYLGKDSFLDAATFRAMYPNLDQWLETKAKYDPRSRVHVRPRPPRRAGALSAFSRRFPADPRAPSALHASA